MEIVTPKINLLLNCNDGSNKENKKDEEFKGDEDDSLNEQNSSKLVKTPNTSTDNVDIVVKEVQKKRTYQYICSAEEGELVKYIRTNLFRRLKIVNEKFTHSIVLQCFDYLQIMDDKQRSLKFRNVLDFLNSIINARRNYLKHQIVRVMQGKYLKHILIYLYIFDFNH